MQRVRLARGRFRRLPEGRWVVARADGTIYAGPYKYQGQTFTRVATLHYFYGTESAARRAWEELGGDKYSSYNGRTITVQRVD